MLHPDLYSHDTLIWDQELGLSASSEVFSLDHNSNDSCSSMASIASASSQSNSSSSPSSGDPIYSPNSSTDSLRNVSLGTRQKKMTRLNSDDAEWQKESEKGGNKKKRKRSNGSSTTQKNAAGTAGPASTKTEQMVTRSKSSKISGPEEQQQQEQQQVALAKSTLPVVSDILSSAMSSIIRVPMTSDMNMMEKSRKLEEHLQRLKDRVEQEELVIEGVAAGDDIQLPASKRQKLAHLRLEMVQTMEKEIYQANVDLKRRETEIQQSLDVRNDLINRMQRQKMQMSRQLMFHTLKNHYQKRLDQVSCGTQLQKEYEEIKKEYQTALDELELIEKLAAEARSKGLEPTIMSTCHQQNYMIECLYKRLLDDTKTLVGDMLAKKIQCVAMTVPNMPIILHMFQETMLQYKIVVMQTKDSLVDKEYQEMERYNTLQFCYLILTNEFLASPELFQALKDYECKTIY